MKPTCMLTVLFLIIFTIGIAQECSDFYPFEEGTSFQITSYSRKGKTAAVTDYTITETSASSATVKSTLKDDKGEVLSDGEFVIHCKNNGVSMDVKSLLNPQLFDQFKDFKTDISGTDIIIPNDLSVGMALPDATMNMAVDMGGISMKMDVSLTDRKVIGEESVTTPAGTFDCYIISYTSNIKMGMNRTGTAKQWFAKGVGMVKQEDYNKKGKITSSSELTKFSR